MIQFMIILCITLANAHPPISTEALKKLNLWNELAFFPLYDPLLYFIKELPVDLIPDIMNYLRFDQAYEISLVCRAEGVPLDPLDRSVGNPLVHHDATADDQAALRKWISTTKNHKSNLLKLMQNPTVDIKGFLGRILLHSANLGDLELVKHLVSMGAIINRNVLKAACVSNNLDLVKFIVEDYQIRPDKFTLLNSYRYKFKKEIVEYIVKKGNLVRDGSLEFIGGYPIFTRNGIILH